MLINCQILFLRLLTETNLTIMTYMGVVFICLICNVYFLQGGSGWWKYEFCYGKQVTQFHEEVIHKLS